MDEPTVANWIGYTVGAGVSIFGLLGIGYLIGKKRCEKRHAGPKNSKHW